MSGVGPFTGDKSEGFDPLTSGLYNSIRVFDDSATLTSSDLRVTPQWLFVSTIKAYEGANLVGSALGPVAYTFDSAIGKFGGYFGTNAVSGATDAPDATAFFYDSNDVLLSTQTIVLGNGGTWTWNGFQSTANDIKRVEVHGQLFSGGFVQMDSMEASLNSSSVVPEPTSLIVLGALFAPVSLARRRKA